MLIVVNYLLPASAKSRWTGVTEVTKTELKTEKKNRRKKRRRVCDVKN